LRDRGARFGIDLADYLAAGTLRTEGAAFRESVDMSKIDNLRYSG
jgi:hypothetical protein